MVTSYFSVIFALMTSIIILAIIGFSLLIQLRFARAKINQLLEAKAKAQEEADAFAELAKNPLGPLMNQNTEPLILSFNEKGIITDANANLLQKFGYTKRTLIGKNAIGTILPAPKKEADNIILRLFKNPHLFLDTETKAQTRDGNEIWVSWTNKISYNAKGKAVSVSAVGFDITKRKEMEAELQYLSSIDPQTGAMNRHALMETAAVELKRAQRYQRALSIVVLKFRAANMLSLSDTLLTDAVELTRRVIRSVDYLGRIGDVEFAMILPETEAKDVPAVINRLAQHMEHYNQTASNSVAFDYAATQFKTDADTIDSLLTSAWKQVNFKPKKAKK